MADAPTMGFGLGSLTFDAFGIGAPSAPASGPAPATTQAATTSPIDPAITGAIATGVTSALTAALGAFGLGPDSPAAREAAARAQADAAKSRMMLIGGAVLVATGVVAFLVLRKPG